MRFRTSLGIGASAALILTGGTASAQLAAGADMLPTGAKPGECYTRVFLPPTYESATTEVMTRAATSRMEVAPAQYETVSEQVLVKEASQKLEVVPATYDFAEERVLVKEASTRMEKVPATYEWSEEQVLVKPAHTTWKKGRGPIEKVNNATGEIMCLVEIPAEYKTVRQKMLKTPATTRVVEIPAEYTTVRRRVMKTPPSTRTVEIPAQYKTVKVRKTVRPPQESKIEIPAEYTNVTQRKLVKEGEMAWRQILCETNIRPNTVTALQRALSQAGHNPGSIDGVVGSDTMAAVRAFQTSKGLPAGGLTIATLDALGVSPR